MSIKTRLILSAIVAAFAMGSAFAAEEPATDASAPAVKAEKKAPKKAHKKAPKKAAKKAPAADASAAQ